MKKLIATLLGLCCALPALAQEIDNLQDLAQ